MRNRNEYLKHALIFENSVTVILGTFLGICTPKSQKYLSETKSFSNKRSALSFNAKVFLLLDMQIIEKSNYWKFQQFMEIRNQFMHNINANNYQTCINKNNQVKLLAAYPQINNLSEEEKLRSAALMLAEDLQTIISETKMKSFEIIHVRLTTAWKLENYERLKKVTMDILNEYLEKGTISQKIFLKLPHENESIYNWDITKQSLLRIQNKKNIKKS